LQLIAQDPINIWNLGIYLERFSC